MGIKEWLKSLQQDHPNSEAAQELDQAIQENREEAEKARETALAELAEVRKLRPESKEVHTGFKRVQEDNHFSSWLFKLLKERPQ